MQRSGRRIGAFLLLISVLAGLVGCSAGNSYGLKSDPTEYSALIAFADRADGAVSVSEDADAVSVRNTSAQFRLSRTGSADALDSLQTGEILCKNLFRSEISAADGTVGSVVGTDLQTETDRYAVTLTRDETVRFPGKAEDASPVARFDFAQKKDRSAFAALKNHVKTDGEETLTVTVTDPDHAQFGARDLDVELKDGRYWLSLTLRAENITGLACYFATDTTPLTASTCLGTLDLTGKNEYVTLTAPVEHPHWQGTLKTLLFRIEGAENAVLDLKDLSLLSAPDTVREQAAQTVWTVYGDRAYFSRVFSDLPGNAVVRTAAEFDERYCTDVKEDENGIAVGLLDGSVLGILRPATGYGTATVERENGTVRIVLTGTKVACGLRLAHGEETDVFFGEAKKERDGQNRPPVGLSDGWTAEYDPAAGQYRITGSGNEITLTVKNTDREFYLGLPDGTWWGYDRKGIRLPLCANRVFPVSSAESTELTLRRAESGTDTELRDFFDGDGFRQISRIGTVWDGLCRQTESRYETDDGRFSVSVTRTRLPDGQTEITDAQYTFRENATVALSEIPLYELTLEHGFEQYSYLDSENTPVRKTAGDDTVCYPGSMPYLLLTADTENAGFLITGNTVTAKGTSAEAPLLLRYREADETGTNRFTLSFDRNETGFVRGDTLTVQIIRTENRTEEQLRELRDGGNFRLFQTVSAGAGDVTATGMEDSVILCAEGYEKYTFPHITVNGAAVTPEYRVYVDGNGKFGFAFSVKNGDTVKIP